MTVIGIHDLELAAPHYALDLARLADATGIDPAKYRIGLGQDEMGVLAPDEDIVTMGATAAQAILRRNGLGGIRTVLFATESGLDQSKAAGMFAHRLLGLPPHVRVIELKQACYGGTAALQTAIGLVSRAPSERVLVIASDVARYELGSPGEPTQGAGAVAMLVSADPALVEIEPLSGLHAADVDDFWRPNDSSTAIVDGSLSVSAYLDALTSSWDDLSRRGGPSVSSIHRFAYHQPFTKMAWKAHRRLAEHVGAGAEIGALGSPGAPSALNAAGSLSELGALGSLDGLDGLDTGAVYNRRTGNTYTASLFANVAALLDHEAGLEGCRIGMFSYGSGCVGEFLTGIVRPGYWVGDRASRVVAALDAREPLEIERYRELHAAERTSAEDYETPRVTRAPFRFAGVSGRARRYEETAA
ncbi:MAG: hydroxymethylglutaryl-CoA synthase family protein [Leucobacter sp.]